MCLFSVHSLCGLCMLRWSRVRYTMRRSKACWVLWCMCFVAVRELTVCNACFFDGIWQFRDVWQIMNEDRFVLYENMYMAVKRVYWQFICSAPVALLEVYSPFPKHRNIASPLSGFSMYGVGFLCSDYAGVEDQLAKSYAHFPVQLRHIYIDVSACWRRRDCDR